MRPGKVTKLLIIKQRARSSVDRAVDFESKGRRFKSSRARSLFPLINQRITRPRGVGRLGPNMARLTAGGDKKATN